MKTFQTLPVNFLYYNLIINPLISIYIQSIEACYMSIKHFLTCLSLLVTLYNPPAFAQGYSLRFFGNGVNAIDQDRAKIRIDDPATTAPGPPVDVGATDFTIEWWMKGLSTENTAPAVTCGNNIDWIYGNIIIDRDRYNQDRKYGISIAGGQVVVGVSGDQTGDITICGSTQVLDNTWHHIVFQRRRSDGFIYLYVDGIMEAQADGPDGDISYPDDGIPGNFCGGPCDNTDPFIVLGAEKHDAGAQYPSFSGWIDELRFSSTLRYNGNFTPSTCPFQTDPMTVGLYHFDEGMDTLLVDSSGATGGPSNGVLKIGGNPSGPLWSTETPVCLVNNLDQPTAISIHTWPNPAIENGVFLELPLEFQSDPEIALFDLSGRKIEFDLTLPPFGGNVVYIQWDRKMASGLIIGKLRLDEQVMAFRIMAR